MKKILIYILLFLSLFVLGIFFLDNIRTLVVKNLNENQKQFIRKIFFGEDEAKLLKKYKLFGKMNYNQLVLPDTQFLQIDYKELPLNKLEFKTSLNKWIAKSVEIFLEQHEDNIIVSDTVGNMYFISKKKLASNNNDFKKYISNFKFDGIKGSIRDLLVHNDMLYVSYSDFNEDECSKINISYTRINNNKLDFQKFFASEDCSEEFDSGRMSIFNFNGTEGIIITSGTNLEGDGAQDDKSSFGKVLFIDFNNRKKMNFAKGLRVPQGLYIEDSLILTAEHGPRGGDEINKIKFGKNYGWPIASYGETYHEENKDKDKYFYKKSHKENGFEEPIYAFVPSIGINQIIRVPESFSKFWKDDFLVTSLNGRSIYRVKMNKDISRVISIEKIFIGKRMRDIIFVKDENYFLLALEGIHNTNSSDNTSALGVFRVEN